MGLVQDYAAVQFPAPWRIAGVRVLPLTIGHVLLLHRLNLPAMPEDALDQVSCGRIALWLWVMSRAARQAAEQLDSWKCRWWLKVVGWQLSGRLAAAHLLSVRDYLLVQWTPPSTFVTPDPDKEPSGVPYVLQLKSQLVTQMGYTPENVLECPVQVAIWDASAVADQAGHLKFVTDQVASEIEELAKLTAQQKAAEGEVNHGA